ncbi:DUF1189 domain-containing protein [Jeotgalibacillus campisalis]|uniref:DUF1189 domain-containing protein n=1 Tax=Jeotgalibacillus campisalis TaxID=220754 RepID=A0A0C2R709_9BACL|nr:DUF1189 domain-containing protein [Jeotgalibacillus campisalis]KIL46005.1 hypothetical protein KR50_26800 [Jeotgalibacillus campisalis]
MNIFKQFWKSLYSPKDIARFRFQGIGKTILFLFFLAIISLIPVIIQVTQLGNTLFTQGEQLLQNELPAFEVVNNSLKAANDEPVTVRTADLTIVIDDTGSIEADDLRGNTNTLALLQQEAVFTFGPQIQQYPYSTFTGIKLSTDGLTQLLSSLEGAKGILYFFIFFVMYVISTGFLFIKVLVFSMIGLLFAKILERKLSYRHSFRIAAYSVALPTLFFTVFSLIGSTIPAANLVNWLVTSIMIYLSVKEIPIKKLNK